MSWKRCTDLPGIALSTPQVIKIGDNVYMGGGTTEHGNNEEIFRYSISDGTWVALLPCPTYNYGLATWNNELIAVGGIMAPRGLITNKVFTFRKSSAKWMQSLPSMITSRYSLSMLSHQNRLIV